MKRSRGSLFISVYPGCRASYATPSVRRRMNPNETYLVSNPPAFTFFTSLAGRSAIQPNVGRQMLHQRRQQNSSIMGAPRLAQYTHLGKLSRESTQLFSAKKFCCGEERLATSRNSLAPSIRECQGTPQSALLRTQNSPARSRWPMQQLCLYDMVKQ